MTNAESMYKDEGYQFMAAAFEVFNELGGGMLEEIYQESIEMELQFRRIPFRQKPELVVFYKQSKLRKRYIPDLLVFNVLIVELKAAAKIAPEHEAQLINYLRITKQPVGYLLNFGPTDKLDWKRMIVSTSRRKSTIGNKPFPTISAD